MRAVKFGSRLVVALLFVAPAIPAAQLTLVLHPGGTRWQVQQAEKITFNQKEKLRAGSAQSVSVQPDAYKSMRQMEILQAGVLRMNTGGFLARRAGDGWEPVLADGLQVKTASRLVALWASTQVTFQADRNSKTATSVPTADIYAIIPGADANEAVAALIADPVNFRGLGEASAEAAFNERLSLLVGMAPLISGSGGAKLHEFLLSGMRGAEQSLSAGLAKKSDLDAGLKFVEASAKAYSDDRDQVTARNILLARRLWLDRRMAILSALYAGELWDDFLNKYGEFDRWDNSFDGLQKERQQAFQQSGQNHRAAGERYYKDKNYGLALGEFQKAQEYLPSDQEIVGLIEKTTIEYQQYIATRNGPVVIDATSERVARNHLAAADLDIGDGKLDEAQKEVDQARGAAPAFPLILLSTAKLRRARNKLTDALRTLDDYFLKVPKDDTADLLRTAIRHDLDRSVGDKKKAIQDGEASGDYVKAWQAAADGLDLNDRDLDFLVHAGVDGAILRKPDAADKLDKYLSLSQTPGADQKQRAEVYSYRSLLAKPTLPQYEGTPNWFSGFNSAAGIMYCPISLMLNPREAEVKSRKETTTFKWAGGHLESIHTTSSDPLDKELQFDFEYSANGNSVRRVGIGTLNHLKEDVGGPRFTTKGTAGDGNGVYVGLPNNPSTDPLMVERITGHTVATIISGNMYFHPFAWVGLYTFSAEYDEYGRVVSAHLISDSPPALTLDFRWDGLKLMEIAERGGDYRRTMIYNDNRLTEERITFRGKTSKIEYQYKGGQLTEADANEDASIDNRPRHVTFR